MRRALAIVCLLCAPAIAEDRERVAVLSVEIEGDAPPELRRDLEKSLDGGLYAGGFDVIRRAEVEKKLRSAPELRGCASTTCLQRIGMLVGVEHFVRARIEAAGGGYTAELQLLGADAPGGVITRVERSCPVCTLAEANDMVSSAAAQLATGPGPEQVRVHVSSDPPGATVEIDGQPAGTAPFEVTLAAGEHAFRATLDGRQPSLQRLAVAARDDGGTPELLLRLAAAGAVVEPAVAAPRYRVWKWVAAASAAALITAGVVHIALDGDGTNCDGPSGAPCRDLYATMPTGILFSGLGLAAGGASGWMFWKDAKDR
jgi:hypothetical protein